MSLALVRHTDSILWELRRFWASGRRVSLSLTDDSGRRLEGQVEAVAATGAWAKVAGLRIDPKEILAVHSPSMLADSTYRSGRFHFESRRHIPQAEELPGFSSEGKR